ncbi:subtilisin-like serine protease [Acrasis kona]|uniref:Subtilisin-like serine protease n=1 Tax=Acrasis kona TaxID=1008807 RepID=A0AAW2Z6N1_9EUKA
MRTTLNHIALAIVAIFIIVHGQESKLSPRVYEQFYEKSRRTNAETSHHIWIIFNDKGPKESHDYASALSELSALAIERRQRHLGTANVIDETDLPVHQPYLQKTLEALDINYNSIRSVSRMLNAISLRVSSEAQLATLTKLPFIKRIDIVTSYKKDNMKQSSPITHQRNVRQSGLNYGISQPQLQQINAIQAHQFNLNGRNVTIALLDAGYRLDHIAFKNTRILKTFNFLYNISSVDNTPSDPENQRFHGTYVFSTVGGSDPTNGFYGPAYAANYLLATTETVSSETIVEEDNFMNGVEWAERNGAQVLSASLGYTGWWRPEELDGKSAITTRAINWATDRGIVCVVSAGNAGAKGISVPADAFNVITVGAVDSTGTIASFSSVGPTYDRRIKPEVSAWGVDTQCANPRGTNGYAPVSGTSLSTPLVAGAVAMLLQSHPTWTVAQVREALMSTASNAASPNNQIGWGIIDVVKANNYAVTATNATAACNCTGHGTCVNGACVCYVGWDGANCQNFVCDPNSCFRGFCQRGGVCSCYLGWSGARCQNYTNINNSAYSNNNNNSALWSVLLIVFITLSTLFH